jgi:hypothetical protein
MVLREHNLPSGPLKKDFREFDEAMFQGVERPYENIFFMLSFEIIDSDEVA